MQQEAFLIRFPYLWLELASETSSKLQDYGGSFPLPRIETFTVGVVGPRGAGKTAFLEALLNPNNHGIVPPPDSARFEFGLPVEYVFRSKPILELKRRKGDREEWFKDRADWPPNVIKAVAIAKQNGSSVSAVRVGIPSPLLQSLSLTLIDLPSDWLVQPRRCFESFKNLGVEALIHLLPIRGESDVDAQFAALNTLPVVYLTNVREADLHRSNSMIAKRKSFIAPASVLSDVLPIDVKALAHRGAEYEIFESAIFLLREHSHPLDDSKVLRNLQSMKSGLDGIAHLALESIATKGSNCHTHEIAIHAARDLSNFLVWCESARQIHSQIDSYSNRLREGFSPYESKKSLGMKADKLVKEYNLKSFTNPENSTSTQSRAQIGDNIVRARQLLLGVVQKLLADRALLALLSSDVQELTRQRERLEDDVVEVALLGMYSSGKSAVINALLGIKNDDRQPKLLPTAHTTETSTINHVEYAESPRLKAVKWMDEVSLKFVTKFGADRWKVHEEELRAFVRWSKHQTIMPPDYELDYTLLAEGKRAQLKARWKGNTKMSPEELLNARRVAGHLDVNQSTLPNEIPSGVRIKRFRKPPPTPPSNIQEAFAFLKRPEIALRVDHVKVGHPDELLKHLRIIDTPGTDSTNPHHRAVSRNLVAYRQCPVIYCFIGDQSASLEDDRNITEALNNKKDRPFFFVITQKGRFPDNDHKVIRNHVLNLLKVKLKMKTPSLFFVEVVKYPDPEFDDFKAALNSFVTNYQKPLIEGVFGEIKKIVDETLNTALRQQQGLHTNESERVKRIAVLKSQHGQLSELKMALTRENGEFEWARKNVERILRDTQSAADAELDRLTFKDAFDTDEIAELFTEFVETLNSKTWKKCTRVSSVLNGQLKSKMGEFEIPDEFSNFRAFSHSESRDFFQGGEFETKVKELDWPSFWWFKFPSTKAKHIQKNQKKIRVAWNKLFAAGEQDVCEWLRKMEEHYLLQLDLALNSLVRERTGLETEQTQTEIDAINERIKHAKNWCSKMEAVQDELETTLAKGNV